VSGLKNKISKFLKLFTGLTVGFGVVSYLSFVREIPVLIAPLAASACIVFTLPNGIFARPKNIILGHALSAAVGVASSDFLGENWFAAAFCVALASALMDATDTMHPPAAATSFVALTAEQGYLFILWPVALGACILVISAEGVKYFLKI
jgi:CBS-domain-containing membrane protein